VDGEAKRSEVAFSYYFVAGCLFVFVIVLGVSLAGGTTSEFVFMQWLNSFAGRSALLDFPVYGLTYYTFSGVLLVSCLWYGWFASDSAAERSRMVAGLMAVFVAGAISRILQLALPTRLRPLHEPRLSLHLPLKVDPALWNQWNSFPGGHSTIYFGLAMVGYLVRPRLGYVMFGIALVLNLSRIYLGVHYPTDVVGGGAVGLLVVFALHRNPLLLSIGDRLLRQERRLPAWFYAGAFFVSFGIATMLDEVRSTAKGVLLAIGGAH